MIIDFHTHVFPPQIVNNREKYIPLDPLFKLLYSENKAKLTTAEDLINNMDAQEIQKSVILNIAWDSLDLCKLTNDYILDSVIRHPDRLIGFCMIKFDSPENAIFELERCQKGGIKGIGEIRPSNEFFNQDSLIKPVIDYIKKHELIVLTHTSEPVGHQYPGKGDITPGQLYSFIIRHPGLSLVCAHWGGGLPFYALMPKVKPCFKDLYFDSAASPFLYSPQVYSQVAQLVGSGKILFGSDYPLLAPRRLLKEIDILGLPLEDKQAILAGNALKLLKISPQ
jgi:uncharacterized protein